MTGNDQKNSTKKKVFKKSLELIGKKEIRLNLHEKVKWKLRVHERLLNEMTDVHSKANQHVVMISKCSGKYKNLPPPPPPCPLPLK